MKIKLYRKIWSKKVIYLVDFFLFFSRNFFEKQLPNPLEIEISSCLDQELLFSWIIFSKNFLHNIFKV